MNKNVDENGNFIPFTEDVYIPSMDENGVKYTKIDKDLFNQCVLSGAFSSP